MPAFLAVIAGEGGRGRFQTCPFRQIRRRVGFKPTPTTNTTNSAFAELPGQNPGTEGQNFGPLSKFLQRPYTIEGGRIWHESLGELKQCPCEKESYHEAGILIQPMNAIEK